MSNASSYGTVGSGTGGGKTEIRNIRTHHGKLLRVQDVDIRADEDESNFDLCDAQFYVDRAPWYFHPNAIPALLYRFRPVSQPHKYLGISGRHIVLKDVPCKNTSAYYGMLCKSSYNFIAQEEVDGYLTFQLRSSSSSGLALYIRTNEYHEVIVARSPSPFLLHEPLESPCKKVSEFILHNKELKYELGDVKLKETSRPADTMSYHSLVRMWRELEEISAQCKREQDQRENLARKLRNRQFP